ncbi:hypothetical protein SAMN05443663_11192 [Flavobacterium defluvii]|uniref:Uncharacterized protein n=1 Tax=Flavobacterium defluvii TaxID=370979 RepID=A0A1M5VPN6_9FLAO|nr:hypothetical protein SAMN05443663_11192 [Flavobacterium defluvii]
MMIDQITQMALIHHIGRSDFLIFIDYRFF